MHNRARNCKGTQWMTVSHWRLSQHPKYRTSVWHSAVSTHAIGTTAMLMACTGDAEWGTTMMQSGASCQPLALDKETSWSATHASVCMVTCSQHLATIKVIKWCGYCMKNTLKKTRRRKHRVYKDPDDPMPCPSQECKRQGVKASSTMCHFGYKDITKKMGCISCRYSCSWIRADNCDKAADWSNPIIWWG